MAQTIGQRLQKEREKRGLSIADVAHDTHIHADTICGLEADDYSVFSSTTYARSFLQLYSRHLEIDADDALHDFDSVADNLSSGGFSYLESVTDAIEAGETLRSHDSGNHSSTMGENRRQPLPLFLTLVVCLLIFMIPVFYFIGNKANSLEEAASILKETIAPMVAAKNTEQQGSEPQEPAANGTAPSPAESVASTDSAQSGPPPPLSEKHRFPRPLPESNNTLPPPATESDTPLKATPVDSKKSNTAQNRN